MANNDFKNTIIDNNVYIRTNINPETTADVISGLTKIEQKIKPENNLHLVTGTIHKPTDFIPDQVVNVYISSHGGEDLSMFSILSLFDMIKAKGAIIRTYNLANASSCAGVIAISGTQGYRYMSSNAFNLIHFGKFSASMTRQSEMDISFRDVQSCNEQFKNLYLANTNLTTKEINKYFEKEGSGKLDAKQCLAKGLCDWVITPNGWVNNVKDLQQKTR